MSPYDNIEMNQLIDKILRRIWKENKIIEETVSQINSRVAFRIFKYINVEAQKDFRVWFIEFVACTAS